MRAGPARRPWGCLPAAEYQSQLSRSERLFSIGMNGVFPHASGPKPKARDLAGAFARRWLGGSPTRPKALCRLFFIKYKKLMNPEFKAQLNTPVEFPQDKCVHQLIEEQV